MKQVGLVGWRGMVGSVLMQRMRDENDFADIDPVTLNIDPNSQKQKIIFENFDSNSSILNSSS